MATLEHYKKAILFKTQNLANTPMPSVIGQLSKYTSAHTSDASVEEGAVMFYMLNQAFGLLQMSVDHKAELTPEQDKLALMYLNSAATSSARLFYYMLLITVREARHLHSSETLFGKLEKSYGKDMADFVRLIKSKNEDGAVSALKGATSSLKDVTLGVFTSCIVDVFLKGQWSGGYGGKPWGNIADTLRKMVHGEISIEIMNDTAWTLAHNNGPMFNKGMLYKSYTSAIYKILDVQRAGMIPQLVAEGHISQYITKPINEAVSAFKAVFPQAFDGYVDWFKVEALGSLHQYGKEKTVQQQKYGKPGTVGASVNPAAKTANEDMSNVVKLYVNEAEYAVVLKKRAA